MKRYTEPKRVLGLPITRWDVEEHIGGYAGVGAGPRTGNHTTYKAALGAMAAIVAAGNGATCSARNRKGEGCVFVLGMVGW